MIKIIFGVTLHSQRFHHPAGTEITYCSEGNDFFQSQLLKAKLQSPACSFGGVAFAPIVCCKSPAYFDAGCEVCFIPGMCQADKPCKGRVAFDFDCPHAKSMPGKMVLDALSLGITFLSGKYRREELHDLGIGIECSKGNTIGSAPRP